MKLGFLSYSDIYVFKDDGSVRRYHHNYCVYESEEEARKSLEKIAIDIKERNGNVEVSDNTVESIDRRGGPQRLIYVIDAIPIC